ncbi:hypothetical protein PR003_g27195 [Phytophthora rubi]|uniref:Extradiol ring-cleavage dioxygenase class III enzyme subunit B domain-containing protein n=1 Tax=Phytophthora rubi TaxID=129364 RepID=A0A6A4C362_9STRA|nr:hypothetical protein PR003_g27195 [Phytophthora rubi]
MSAFRHPAVVVSHGPGPLWLLSSGFNDEMNKDAPAAKLLSTLFEKLYPNDENLPKRILFVSAHFESNGRGFEISNAAAPDLIFDYYGFDREAYDIDYPAKGEPAFAQRVKEQLEKNKIKAKLAHFDLGKALAPFRDEDTLILCSGQSTHNLHALQSRSPVLIEGARAFQSWLDETLSSESKLSLKERTEEILHWQDEPAARFAHPTPDHFMPFIVAAGAGMEDKKPGATAFFGGWAIGHMSFANYAWGIQH